MKTFSRPAVRIAVALIAVVGMLVLVVGPVFAHSYLKSIDPADGSVLDSPPDEIALTFTANVLPDFTQVVIACNGQDLTGLPPAIASDNVVRQPVGAAASGDCVVTFRIVSADSHPVTGRSTFTVNAPAAPTSPSTAPTESSAPASAAASASGTPEPSSEGAAESSSPEATPLVISGNESTSSWGPTALLLLLAAALLGLFAWLAKGRNRRR